MVSRPACITLIIALLAGCVSLPPGSDYPKTISSALAHPEETRLGRQFEGAIRASRGNSGFRMLAAGVEGFLTRVQMANAAERTLDLQYYILRDDDTGKLLADAVLRAADRNVRVRVLIDDADKVAGDEQIVALDAHPQIEIRIFNPFAYRGNAKLFRSVEFLFSAPRLDYRMHNKLFVVDNAIALIGERNIGSQYFQIDPRSQFGDDDVFAAGPVVKELSANFDQYWNSAISIPTRALAQVKASVAALDDFRQALKEHRQKVKTGGIEFASRVATGEPLAGMISGKLPLDLLRFVEASGCQFNRNGAWHDAKAARAHIVMKYEYLLARDGINTTEDFIDKAATGSSMLFGQPYTVKCDGDRPVRSSVWLSTALARYRAIQP